MDSHYIYTDEEVFRMAKNAGVATICSKCKGVHIITGHPGRPALMIYPLNATIENAQYAHGWLAGILKKRRKVA